MPATKPVVYISSTVYDFRDLRSSLKFWLETLGYEVMLSDYNDFTKPLDKNSYEACIAAIDRADFFLVLIGSRVGGLYDQNDNVSITRMEYRRAYERAKSGKVRLIAFVRKELLDVREDRKALEQVLVNDYQKSHELADTEIKQIVNHKSNVVNDAAAIFDFLKEVGRVEEMKAAMAGKSPFPPANWIHPFASFQEVVDALRVAFGVSHGLARIALEQNLKRELLRNLQSLTTKSRKGEVLPMYLFASTARRQVQGGLRDTSTIESAALESLVVFCICGTVKGSWLSTRALDQAITSGEFLEFDSSSNIYRSGALENALHDLRNTIERIQKEEEIFEKRRPEFIINHEELREGNDSIAIRNQELVAPLAIHDHQEDAVSLSCALLKALQGNTAELQIVQLHPSTPFVPDAQQLEREIPTLKEIEDWATR
jgi:hypothetical protein